MADAGEQTGVDKTMTDLIGIDRQGKDDSRQADGTIAPSERPMNIKWVTHGSARRDIVAILLLVCAAFLYFAGAFWPQDGRLLFGYDVFRMFYPFGAFAGEAFRAGQLPLWNSSVFLGFPQYAEPQLSTFYPLTWLLAWMPATFAFPWQYSLHFAWTAIGGYVLVRRLGGGRAGASLAGMTLAFALTMTVRPFVGHLPHVMTLSWMPWILAAAHWAVEKRSWAVAVAAGVPLGLAFLVGYIPYLVLLVPGISLFMLWLGWLAWREGDRRGAAKILGQLLVIGLTGALLAGAQLLPAAEFALHSNRASGRYNYRDNEPVSYAFLLTALLPDLYGALQGPVALWAEHLSIDFYSEWAMYVGILPLLLLPVGWLVMRRQDRFWIFLALFGVLLALGDKAGLNRLLYDFVPGMNAFRFASRPIYFFTLGAAVTAGLTFDRWFALSPERHAGYAARLKRLLLIITTIGAGLLLIAVVYHYILDSEQRAAATWGFIRQGSRALLLILAGMSLLIWGYGRPKWAVLLAALAMIILDLWGQGQKFLTYVSGEPYSEWAVVDRLLPQERDDFRVLTKVLEENGGYFFDLESIYGYDGFTLEASETMHDLAVADARVVRLLSGRYLIHGPGWDLPIVAPGWEPAVEESEIAVFQRSDYGPRAFMVHDVIGVADEAEALSAIQRPELDFTRSAVVQMLPDTRCDLQPASETPDRVEIVARDDQQITIAVQAQSTGWLVLNELYYPGWRVTVDGLPATIQPTNYALRGVCVPAGNHQVTFTFAPRIAVIGAALSVVALAAVGVAVLFLLLKRRASSHATEAASNERAA